jgi:biopolymer transport protein ExbD
VVVFDDKKVSVDDLDQLVNKALQENPNLIVSIHAKPDATYHDFVVVLRQVKRGNAPRIFINHQGS